MIKVQEVLNILNEWAPPVLAWEKDNIGLLVGDPGAEVTGILVALDVTREVVHEARERGANLIVAHHPVIFHPLQSIRTDTPQGELLRVALGGGINIIAVHTNVDITDDGLNHYLARALGLRDLEPLDAVAGHGRVLWMELTSPNGAVEELESRLENMKDISWRRQTADERAYRYEIHGPSWMMREVRSLAQALERFGPLDVGEVCLEGPVSGYGLGVVGRLDRELAAPDFLEMVKGRLGVGFLRASPALDRSIRRVAVCGGAGSSLLSCAVTKGVDAFVTSDISYHSFHDAAGALLLVDAGHYETEQVFIKSCAQRLEKEMVNFPGRIPILSVRTCTNVVQYV